MKLTLTFSIILTVILTVKTYSQNLYDIKLPDKEDYYKKCEDCINLLNTKPNEIQFGIQKDDADNLFFVVTHKAWFDQLIKKSSDGIAIDIVSKDRYDCSTKPLNNQTPIKGDLQKPLYKKELEQNMFVSENGSLAILMGKVPQKYIGDKVEFNIILIKNNNLCYYNSFYDLESYRWDLLDMGFYFDTLTYKSDLNQKLTEQESYILKNKRLKFEIPFEKNKSEYSNADIKPLYDSLRLTDFTIKKITIRAYSSIEGDEERNYKLQQERAQNIAKALQSFQTPSIITEILVSENWVDFLNDMSNTQFSDLTQLSKEEIKEKISDKKLQSQLEPYLQKHRKAIIILELQKKDKYENIASAELIELFSKSIAQKNLEQAIDIQNSLFEKVSNHQIPVNYINKLEIPEKSEFSLLLNKNSIFKYLMNEHDVFSTYKELMDLNDLIPNDGHIKYNICALKFKVWLLGEHTIDPPSFKKEINELKKYGIPLNLVKRMLMNYEIIMSEYYMAAGDYVNKDKSLKFIYANYKYIPLADPDYLSLAQYFASYTKYDWATKLLEKKVKNINVNEDLLFYYLNLTIINESITKKPAYRTVLLNAYNINPTRFCGLFEPFGQGGVTFQLLDNEYLRKTYCESCNN